MQNTIYYFCAATASITASIQFNSTWAALHAVHHVVQLHAYYGNTSSEEVELHMNLNSRSTGAANLQLYRPNCQARI